MSLVKMGGLTKGIVVDVNDPAGFGRVKVRIPELHGLVKAKSYGSSAFGSDLAQRNRIEDKDLPWCEVSHPYGSTVSPEINQVVLVGFIDGSSKQPVILGWLGYNYTETEDVLVSLSVYNTST